jgi:hypothetical protein
MKNEIDLLGMKMILKINSRTVLINYSKGECNVKTDRT